MVRYEKNIVHYMQDQDLLKEQPLHPGRARMDSWLDAVPKDTLRWHVVTRTSSAVLKKSVQRSALQGKWYKMVCQALAQRGYLPDGRKIDTREKGLAGTMEIMVVKGLGFTEPPSELLDRASKIVAAVEAEQKRQNSNGAR